MFFLVLHLEFPQAIRLDSPFIVFYLFLRSLKPAISNTVYSFYWLGFSVTLAFLQPLTSAIPHIPHLVRSF